MLGVERLPQILFGVKAFLPATFFKSAVRSRNPAGCRPCGSLATTHGVCMIIARQVEGNIQAGEKCIMDRACCPNDFSGYGRTSAKRGSFSFLRNLALRRSAATSNRSDFDLGNRPFTIYNRMVGRFSHRANRRNASGSPANPRVPA